MDLTEPLPAGRRRGKALEDALLDAAWQALAEGGYGAFTIEAVADRAGTSRPVLYRRWPDRESLVMAAVQHHFAAQRTEVPDTGSLRGDIVAILEVANQTRSEMAVIASVQLGGYFQETGQSLSDLRRAVIGSRPASIDLIMQRAVDRGEIDPDVLTPRIAALPFDLFRHEVLMTLRPVSQAALLEIVDDIFLPLVRRKT